MYNVNFEIRRYPQLNMGQGQEILKRVKELEDFYDIAIDRELKMMKLKKQLEDMKIKLDKYENQKKNIPQD